MLEDVFNLSPKRQHILAHSHRNDKSRNQVQSQLDERRQLSSNILLSISLPKDFKVWNRKENIQTYAGKFIFPLPLLGSKERDLLVSYFLMATE